MEPGAPPSRWLRGQAFFTEEAMDWRHAMEPPPARATAEDEAAYAAGWTISGLVTIATIVAVWMFAI